MLVYDTIIVGMGAAGCTAASVLCKAGKRVLAVEAQQRVGGRVNTVSFGSGVVELGAEWIHGERNSRVYELAIEHNVQILSQDIKLKAFRDRSEPVVDVPHNICIVPRDGSFLVFRSDGSTIDKNVVHDLVTFAMGVVDSPSEEPQPLGEYISKRLIIYIKSKYPVLFCDEDFIKQFMHFMELLVNNYEASESWNDVTTLNNYKNLDGDLHLSWHKYGYKTLFDILLNVYQNRQGYPTLSLKLGKVVNKIKYPQDPAQDVEVTCKDGSIFKARNVIVTVSLGVLKERYTTMFSPLLPEEKAAAINTISIGVTNKIVLLFSESWWPQDCTFFAFIWRDEERSTIPTEDAWVTTIFGVSLPAGCGNALTMWTSGEPAKLVETLPEDLVRRKSMELIRRFMGSNKTIPEPIAMLRTMWYSNPYTRGSYSYDNLLTPLHPYAREILAEPLVDSSGSPRVLFAGEATSSIHFSTVHGAADTGHREAIKLLPHSKLWGGKRKTSRS